MAGDGGGRRGELIRFDHMNIRVTDQEAVRDFLAAVVELTVGPRPPFDFPGYWLYLGDQPVIHLAPRDHAGEIGWVNHIAFTGYDFDKKTAALKAAGYAFKVQTLPGTDIRQIFLNGPEGVRIELQCPPKS
jgi:catechol 2,3-dioxygenase-like lactoylglutathione lyase family enzyme